MTHQATTATTSAPASPRRRPRRSPLGVLLAILAVLGARAYWSAYYLAAPAERVRSPLHAWLRPSGYLGQSAGIAALLIFLFLWLYPLRKRSRRMAWTGSVARWLEVHVALALVLPFVAALHAGWRFDGLIGLGFWSMMVVWGSGIVGRYLYVHIPRGAAGLELTAEEIAAERRALMHQLAGSSGLPPAQVEALLRTDPSPMDGLGVFGTIRQMIRDEFARRRQVRALRREAGRVPGGGLDRTSLRRVVKLARRQVALTQQARLLGATRRVFRLWHLVHRPFAIAALVAVLAHVGVAIAMGMTWFW
jgi:hypothetical protein